MKEIAKKILWNPREKSNGIEVVPEFEHSTGRTDLVFINISEPYWRRRIDKLNIGNAIEEKSHLQTFLQLHARGEITKEYFLEIGAFDEREKERSLQWLIDNGFVVSTEGEKIRTAPSLRPHVTTAIAVELKLSKWKRALKQARGGGKYSNYQYVVLDADHVSPAIDNISLFREHNVGLMSIDESGDYSIHHRPKRIRPNSLLNRWRLNEVSASILA